MSNNLITENIKKILKDNGFNNSELELIRDNHILSYHDKNNNLFIKIADSEFKEFLSNSLKVSSYIAKQKPESFIFQKPIHEDLFSFDDKVVSIYEWVDGEANQNKISMKERGIMTREMHDILSTYPSVGELSIRDWKSWILIRINKADDQDLNNKINKFNKVAQEAIAIYEKSNKEISIPSHGDFHLGNIVLTKSNKLMIIDWDSVSICAVERDLAKILGSEKPYLKTSTRKQVEELMDGYGKTYNHVTVDSVLQHERINNVFAFTWLMVNAAKNNNAKNNDLIDDHFNAITSPDYLYNFG